MISLQKVQPPVHHSTKSTYYAAMPARTTVTTGKKDSPAKQVQKTYKKSAARKAGTNKQPVARKLFSGCQLLAAANKFQLLNLLDLLVWQRSSLPKTPIVMTMMKRRIAEMR